MFVSYICGTQKSKIMTSAEDIRRPTNAEQRAAKESYDAFEEALKEVRSEFPEVEMEESGKRIKIPKRALEMLAQILKQIGKGRPVSIVPIATEVTTQAAAEILGCSRPHVVKLLESGEIRFTKVGKHRRIKYRDLMEYKRKRKAEQRRLLIDMMKADEESGLYDS